MNAMLRTDPASPSLPPRCLLGGVPVDLLDADDAIRRITARASGADRRPLAVVSANLDHVHHFGRGRALHGALMTSGIEVLTLLDGMPLVRAACRLTGRHWPRLAGSDLIAPILLAAERHGLSVGFLGGSEEAHRMLRAALPATYPRLRVNGWWSPPRSVVEDAAASRKLAAQVRTARVDVLVVGLGKPRQELWIAEHGASTGARVLLAFGAVVDFLAGRIPRCPAWMSTAGLEWSYRLAREPRRLARRYLVQGPQAYLSLRLVSATTTGPAAAHAEAADATRASGAVVIPAHNEEAVIGRGLAALAPAVAAEGLEVVVVANACTDRTALVAASYPGTRVIDLPLPGKSGALNAADACAVGWPRLYLDADIDITAKAVRDVFAVLRAGTALAARPPFVYDTTDASWPVRAFYRARTRLPDTSRHLWGAGTYALSEPGHRRLERFPDLVADDLYVDSLFGSEEKTVVQTDPVVVHTPKDLRSLVAVLRRTYAGNAQVSRAMAGSHAHGGGGTARALARSATSPRRLGDAAVYAALVTAARLIGPTKSWARDQTGRRRPSTQPMPAGQPMVDWSVPRPRTSSWVSGSASEAIPG